LWPAGLYEHYQWYEPLYFGDLRLAGGGAAVEFLVPFFTAADLYPRYYTFARVSNRSDQVGQVYVEVWSDDGTVHQEVYLGEVPARGAFVFNSHTVSELVPGLSSHNFVALVRVEGVGEVYPVVMRKGPSPTGTSYIPVYEVGSGSGSGFVVPFFVAETLEGYLSFVRIFNPGDSAMEVRVTVWSDDGEVYEEGVLLGEVGAKETEVFNSSRIVGVVPALSGRNFSVRFEVSPGPCAAVAVRKGPQGTSYVPLYSDSGELIHR